MVSINWVLVELLLEVLSLLYVIHEGLGSLESLKRLCRHYIPQLILDPYYQLHGVQTIKSVVF